MTSLEVKTGLPELTPLRRYLSRRAALLDIFETVCPGVISGKTSGNRGPLRKRVLRSLFSVALAILRAAERRTLDATRYHGASGCPA
jgi:hypothetical protein